MGKIQGTPIFVVETKHVNTRIQTIHLFRTGKCRRDFDQLDEESR